MEASLELLECARYGEEEELSALISSGAADVSYQDDHGNSALHKCCANGHTAVAKMLIEAGAKYMPNKKGNFPLQWAIRGQHLEVVKLLLASYDEIDVTVKNEFGKSLVSDAIGSNNVDLARLILEHPSAEKLEKTAAVDLEKADEQAQQASSPPNAPEVQAPGAGLSPSHAKKLQAWRAQKEQEWSSNPDGKLRKKYPTRADLNKWMVKQCSKAIKANEKERKGSRSDGPKDEAQQALADKSTDLQSRSRRLLLRIASMERGLTETDQRLDDIEHSLNSLQTAAR